MNEITDARIDVVYINTMIEEISDVRLLIEPDIQDAL